MKERRKCLERWKCEKRVEIFREFSGCGNEKISVLSCTRFFLG